MMGLATVIHLCRVHQLQRLSLQKGAVEAAQAALFFREFQDILVGAQRRFWASFNHTAAKQAANLCPYYHLQILQQRVLQILGTLPCTPAVFVDCGVTVSA